MHARLHVQIDPDEHSPCSLVDAKRAKVIAERLRRTDSTGFAVTMLSTTNSPG